MSITGQILAAAAILGGLGVIGRAVWWLAVKVLRPLALVIDDWRGEPDRPGVPGRPGVMVQLAELRTLLATEQLARRAMERRLDEQAARLTAIEAQLKPNGGGSLRDVVDQALSELPRSKTADEPTQGGPT